MTDMLIEADVLRALANLADVDWEPLRLACEHRRASRRVFRAAVEAAPPGAILQAWDEDKITLGVAQEALRWRHHKGLEP